MKTCSTSSLFAGSLLSLLSLAPALAGPTIFGSGALTTNDATFVNPGGSRDSSGIQYHDVIAFSVDTAGLYTFELSSLKTSTGSLPSDAIDTLLLLYPATFNPATPNNQITYNDDFSSAFTLLPGPFSSAGLAGTGTGFRNAQPASRIANANLSVGSYNLVISSFRATDYVPPAAPATDGGPTGNYWYAMNGVGNILVAGPNPSLRIAPTNAAIIIAWSTNTAGWTLQASTNLITANWTAVTNLPNVVGVEKQVTLTPTTGQRYFRLSSP